MPALQPSRIAVIADAHFHDLHADYGHAGIVRDGSRMTARLLADTARSTRVFNESDFALRHALDKIAADGIRDVVLLGDYSDDGQAETVRGVKRLLDSYVAEYGMRFHATVGNHDIFGASGRHRSKRFINEDGSYSIVSSDAAVRDRGAHAILVDERMYCAGYPGGLEAMADFGFYPRPDDLHWETPFGHSGEPADRLYEVTSPDGKSRRRLMDASYLVEPFAGVWLLMIDANVFVPVDGVPAGEAGDLADSTSAGWNAMLVRKRFVLDWMKDVSSRARREGKCLLAFSHYPVLDPLDGTVEDELALLGRTGMVERIPQQAVAEALIAAGIEVHFSGHLHVNDTARYARDGAFLINLAMPSLVAFPCAYKVITVGERRLEIETVGIGEMQPDARLRRVYETEIVATGLDAGGMLHASDYGTFLFEHLGHLVSRRFLKREWPKELATMLRTLGLADVAALALVEKPVTVADAVAAAASIRDDDCLRQALAGTAMDLLRQLTAMDMLRDWYRLRMASELALDWIPKERMALYRAIGRLFAKGDWQDRQSAQARLALMFRMLEKFVSGLPSNHFSIDRNTGEISRRGTAEAGDRKEQAVAGAA
ncbi:metallophosphoesterase family protein [Rhizobium sp. Root482]|uniref:metallophosphoesterase family protein n=1 Tax=Rhizobium sp. Root482 TaxID=1736543 RepID=UPI0006FF1C60|nr:metallophosphoesterase [Rhizobium sp. Root482]KQY15173.1 hypothetical protein ASD31_07165 [Rhizobium sp. Root482]